MGRAQVRASVQSFLQGAGVPYLGTVFPARPVIMEEQDYVQTMNGQAISESTNGSACVVVVDILSDRRVRITDTGRGAVDDTNVHQITLELFFVSTSGAGVNAQQDYDTVVDALIVSIRSNPAPTNIWSLGEFSAGVRHDQDLPYSSADGMSILINGTIGFEAWEWVSGVGV